MTTWSLSRWVNGFLAFCQWWATIIHDKKDDTTNIFIWILVLAAFYMASACGSFLFLRLAAKWPELMQQWELVDAQIPKWRHPQQYRRFALRARLLIALILAIAFAEHVLSIVSSVTYARDCLNQTQSIEDYIRIQSVQLFEVVSYSIWGGLIGKLLNIIATFVWNFMDLFIMLISIGLTSMFRRFSQELYRIKGEVCTDLSSHSR